MSTRNQTCHSCGCHLEAAVAPPQAVRCPKCDAGPSGSARDDGPTHTAPSGEGPLLLAVSLAGLSLVGGGVAAVVFWPDGDSGRPMSHWSAAPLYLTGRAGPALSHAAVDRGTGHPLTGADASRIAAGRRVFETNNCERCHPTGGGARATVVRGQGGKGVQPVDLRGVGARRGLEYLREHVRDSKAHHPESRIPPHGEDLISSTELRDLGAYLGSLK